MVTLSITSILHLLKYVSIHMVSFLSFLSWKNTTAICQQTWTEMGSPGVRGCGRRAKVIVVFCKVWKKKRGYGSGILVSTWDIPCSNCRCCSLTGLTSHDTWWKRYVYLCSIAQTNHKTLSLPPYIQPPFPNPTFSPFTLWSFDMQKWDHSMAESVGKTSFYT